MKNQRPAPASTGKQSHGSGKDSIGPAGGGAGGRERPMGIVLSIPI